MPWNDEDTRTYIKELQFLQREILLLQKTYNATREPSLEKTIDALKNSQNKLYTFLTAKGVTPEDAHRIIMENNDKALVKEILKLQKSRNTIDKKLSNPNLPQKTRQTLEHSLTLKNQAYKDKYAEIINHPNKSTLIRQIEHAQTKTLQKSRDRDRTRELGRSH